MKLVYFHVYGEKEFDRIYDVKFSPSVSIITDTIPINSFTAKVISDTDPNFRNGLKIALVGDGVIYAKYYITKAKHIEKNVWEIVAEDMIAKLENVTLKEEYIGNMGYSQYMEHFIDQIDLATKGAWSPKILTSGDFSEDYILGFLPEQTARERLQYVLFTIGAYIQTPYYLYAGEQEYDGIIRKTPDLFTGTPKYIPQSDVYWKPSVGDEVEYFTNFSCDYFALQYISKEDVESVTEYVEVKHPDPDTGEYLYSDYYKVTRFNASIERPLAGTLPQEIKIAENYLLNIANFESVMQKALPYYWYGDLTAEATIKDNLNGYRIGDFIGFCTGAEKEIVYGYIISMDYDFSGKKVIAKVTIKVIGKNNGYNLKTYNAYIDPKGTTLFAGEENRVFPGGFNVSYSCRPIDFYDEKAESRKILIPEQTTFTYTMPEQDTVQYIYYRLCMEIKDGKAYIYDASYHEQNEGELVFKSPYDLGFGVPGTESVDEITWINYEDALYKPVKNGIMTVEGIKSGTASQEVLSIE